MEKTRKTSKQLRKPPFYTSLSDWLEHVSQAAFGKLGGAVARYPWWVLLGCAAFVGLHSLAWNDFQTARDGFDLWSPPDAPAFSYRRIAERNFGFDPPLAFMMYTQNGDKPLLTKANVDQIWGNYFSALKIKVIEREIVDEEFTYKEICARDLSGECRDIGLLKFWGSDYEYYQSRVKTDADLLRELSSPTFPDGTPVPRHVIFGDLEVDDEDNVVAARGVQLGFTLTFLYARPWVTAFNEIMPVELSKLVGVNGYFFTSFSIDDELSKGVSGELSLVAFGYLLMMAFVCLTLGPLHKVKGRRVLGALCVLTIGCATYAAYGMANILGIPFTSLAQILPFVIVGVGVDDGYIIVNALDATNPTMELHERMKEAMSRVGLAITYTTLTDFVAFMFGSLSTLKSVRYFCIYAAISILYDFVLQITAFVAILAIDERRQAAGRWDILCCLGGRRSSRGADLGDCCGGEGKEAELAPVASIAADAMPRTMELGGAPSAVRAQEVTSYGKIKSFSGTALGKLFECYSNWLMRPSSKILVLMATAALAAVSGWGLSKVEVGFDMVDLASPTSSTAEFVHTSRGLDFFYFDDFPRVGLHFGQLDYASANVQKEILRVVEAAQEDEHTKGPADNWVEQFLFWASQDRVFYQGLDPETGFYTHRESFPSAISAFLSHPAYVRFNRDMRLGEDGLPWLTRIVLFHSGTTTVQDQIKAMRDIRAVCSGSALEPPPFPYAVQHLNTEQFVVLYEEILTNFAMVLVAVFLLSLLILGRMRYTLLSVAIVALIDMEILASVYFLGMHVNAMTTVGLIMAVGLVVDYVVHIVHFFMQQDPSISRNERVKGTLREIGPSVLCGVTTTFIGVLPMATADSIIFSTFFRMLAAIVVLGAYHGLVVMPVLLTMVPEGHQRTMGKESSKLPEAVAVGKLQISLESYPSSRLEDIRQDALEAGARFARPRVYSAPNERSSVNVGPLAPRAPVGPRAPLGAVPPFRAPLEARSPLGRDLDRPYSESNTQLEEETPSSV
ncbi:unnamed protein product [Chrysoparadoxa australica]